MNKFLRKLLQAAALPVLFFGLIPGLHAKMPDTIFDETPRDYWQFLFLYESTKAPGQHEFILRPIVPIYGRYKNEERAYSFSHVLYPLFYSHGTNHWKKWTFAFFFAGDDVYHQDTRQDSDLSLAPFLFWGRGDTEKERYFGLFPFYGNYKDKLGWSEINYVMFPLYASWSHKEYKAHSILWPLVMWGGSPTRDDLRILFIYSRKSHLGKYERKSVLWPFVQWGHEDLNKKEPRSYLLVWPFYGRKWSENGNLNVHGIGPMLITMPLVAWGSDKRTNSFNLNVLWFLYRYERNDNPYIRMNLLFPIWGYYIFDKKEAYFKGPLFVSMKTHSSIFESETDVFFPLYWRTDRYYLKDWKQETFLKMWPFFQYVKDNRGNVDFRSLTLWPMRSDKFERYWSPVVALTEYREFENGDRFFSLLLRAYSQYWNEREMHIFLLGFEFHSTPRYWSIELAGGLLGYRHDYGLPALPNQAGAHAKNTIRFFWLDL